jgi:hypothetical protein
MLKLDKDTGVIVTGVNDIKTQIDIAIELAAHLNADAEIQTILSFAKKEVEKLAPKRNNIVHGVYSLAPQAMTLKIENPRRKKGRKRADITPAEISKVGSDIYALAKKIMEVFQRHGILVD